ncbi:hypothetical protein IJT17_08705 [bacterium]|nr:hypothetical protein [bacterium]
MSDIYALNAFQAPKNGCSVALGFFDGVHKGHQQILSRTLEMASAQAEEGAALLPIVYSFANHPSEVLYPQRRLELLSTAEERWERLCASGLKGVCERFTPELAAWEPRAFFERVLLQRLRARVIVCGPNYRFGRGAAGTPQQLEEWGRECGLQVCRVGMASYKGETISSSRLRAAVRAGKMRDAKAMLGEPFKISNTVERGQQLGRRWGFPTANLEWPAEKVAPAWGAYACLVRLPDGQMRPAVGYLGSRPTLNQSEPEVRLEVNIGNWSQGVPRWDERCWTEDDEGELMLYGQRLTVYFLELLAPQRRCENMDALRRHVFHCRQLADQLGAFK